MIRLNPYRDLPALAAVVWLIYTGLSLRTEAEKAPMPIQAQYLEVRK